MAVNLRAVGDEEGEISMKKLRLEKILVPVDFSDFSEEALHKGLGLAEDYGATLLVLHVMLEPQTSMPYEVYVDWEKIKAEVSEDSEKHMSRLITDDLKQRVNIEPIIAWGDPALKILQVAKDKGVDLIVMATHGRTGLSRVFMGSVADRIVRKAHCPVMVIRSREGEH